MANRHSKPEFAVLGLGRFGSSLAQQGPPQPVTYPQESLLIG